MNTPVSFEIAKLLKEKDIKIDTEEVLFYKDEVNNIKKHQIKNRDVLYNYTGFSNYIPDENEYQTYMISEVVMWFYEKHGIFIQLFPAGENKEWRFYSKIIVNDNGWIKIQHQISKFVNTPTEAYEAAIEYVLENLI